MDRFIWAPSSEAPTGDDQVVIPDDDTLLRDLLIYGTITLCCLGLYIYLVRRHRGSWFTKHVLEPRGSVRFRDMFWLERKLFLKVHESEFVAQSGMDAYMAVRLIRLAAILMFVYSLVACALLLPVYRGQGQSEECRYHCEGVFNSTHKHQDNVFLEECVCSATDKFSLANVGEEDELGLWVPVFGIGIITIATLYLLLREYKEVVRLRCAYWMSRPPDMFSVLIDDIPTHLDIHTSSGLRNHFEKIFPGGVVRVDPVRFQDEAVLSRLRKVSKQRMHAYDYLTRLLAMKERYGDAVPTCHSICLNSCTVGNLEEEIEKTNELFKQKDEEFSELQNAFRKLEQQEADGKLSRKISACFVTFNKAMDSTMAQQAMVDHRYNVVTMEAPEPGDMRWDSIGYGVKLRSCTKYLGRFGFFLLVLFWGVFTAFVGAMTSVSSLENEYDSFHDFMEDNPWVRDLLDQAAPLVLSSLMAIVNPLVCLLAKVEARASESNAEHVATIWYFVFLVIQVFIFFGVSGSVVRSISAILNQPGKIIDTLADNIPKNSSFYIQFIITKFVTSLCMDLFRVSDVIVHYIRRIIFGASLSERDQTISRCGCSLITQMSHRNLSSLNGQLFLLMFIGTTYAVIQPLIVIVAMFFFVFAYFVYARLFLTVNVQRFDSGGTMWPKSYWCFCSALFTAQLTLVGLLSLKKGIWQPSIVFLIFLVTLFAAAMIDFRYRTLVMHLPLDVAAKVDQGTDPNDPGTFKTASVWQHDTFSRGEPNYLGRYIWSKFPSIDTYQLAPISVASGATGDLESNGEAIVDYNPLELYSYELPVMRESMHMASPISDVQTNNADQEDNENENQIPSRVGTPSALQEDLSQPLMMNE